MKNEWASLKNELEQIKQWNANLREEIANLTKSCLQSNEIITTVLSEIQQGSKSSMLSLHNLVNALEHKISLLLSKSISEDKRRFKNKNDDTDFNQVLNLNEKYKYDERNNNALQDTHQFLQQAINTLRNSSMRIKEVIESTDEPEDNRNRNLNQKKSISKANTYDNENEHNPHDSSLMHEGKIAKSFEYYLGKRNE